MEALRYRSVLEDREKGMGLRPSSSSSSSSSKGAQGMGESKAERSSPPRGDDGRVRAYYDGEDSSGVDRWLAFTLVVVPDLFMTLEVCVLIRQA